MPRQLIELLEARRLLSAITYLSDLPWLSATSGWGPVEKDMSNGDLAAADGHILTLDGVTYPKGLGVHASSELIYNLGGNYSSFLANVGVDDEVGNRGSVMFQVWVDAVKLYDSGLMTGASPTQLVSLDVTGKQELRLIVTNSGDNIYYDHADWAGAALVPVGVQTPSGMTASADATYALIGPPAGATLAVSSGTVTLNADAASSYPNLVINISGGATVIFNSTQHLAAVNIESGAAILAAGGGKVLVTKSLSINTASGRFDLADNATIIDYDGTSPGDAIRSYLVAGRGREGPDGATWLGNGVMSSTAAALDPTSLALGYREAADPQFLMDDATVFAGQAVDSTAILIRCIAAGDANLDGVVNRDDFNIVAALFGDRESGTDWMHGDFDYNNTCNRDDLNLVISNFGQTAPTTPPGGLAATYFDNADLTAPLLARVDPAVDFNWGASAPVASMGPDTFSIRWTGQIQPAYSQTYTFTANADDGVRLWIDNLPVIDNWDKSSSSSGIIYLAAGQSYDLRMEYHHNRGAASVQLLWSGDAQPSQITPTAALSPNTTPQRAQQVLYVDNQNPDAVDANSGTLAAPLKTLAKAGQLAVANNKLNIATRIIIAPGTYRESLKLTRNAGQTDAPISFEAATKGTVIIDGADVWTGWQPTATPDVYTHTWAGNWGIEPTPSGWPTTPELLRRREILFLNGKLMTPVLMQSDLVDNSFFVDDAGGAVYLKVAPGVDPNTSLSEWGTRASSVKIDSRKNVTLSGLVIQHDTSAFNKGDAVSFPSSSNIVMEDCTVQWNSQSAVSDSLTRNLIQRRNIIDNNGGTGVGGYRIRSLLMEGNDTSYNNWRGGLAGFTGWAYGGIKQLYVHDAVYRNHTSIGNQARGIWLDTDVSNILIDNANIHDNIRDGIFLEASQGPITIKNSIIAHNTNSGLSSANAANVTLQGNIFYGNWLSTTKSGAQLNISGNNEGRTFTNWETGQSLTTQSQNWKLLDNQIVGTNSHQLLTLTTLTAPIWQLFATSLSSSGNLFWNPASTMAFQRDSGIRMDLPAWRANTTADANSLWTDPKYKDPANFDFTRLP